MIACVSCFRALQSWAQTVTASKAKRTAHQAAQSSYLLHLQQRAVHCLCHWVNEQKMVYKSAEDMHRSRLVQRTFSIWTGCVRDMECIGERAMLHHQKNSLSR